MKTLKVDGEVQFLTAKDNLQLNRRANHIVLMVTDILIGICWLSINNNICH